MQLKPGNFCPIMKEECVQFKCAWFTKVEGYDINTGKQVEEWNCAMTFIPMLLIENSGMSRQTGAAVESFRNEMVKSNEATQQIFTNMLSVNKENNTKLLDG
jgi:Zn-finger protein